MLNIFLVDFRGSSLYQRDLTALFSYFKSATTVHSTHVLTSRDDYISFIY